MEKLLTLLGSVVVFCLLLFWFLFLNHIGIQQFGIAYDSWNGEVAIQEHPGWYVTSPFVSVASISTLPMQICLNSGARVLNCKLVRFRKEGVQEFIKDQGFHYYYGIECNNRGQNQCGLANILKGYAYSGKKYEFLEILEEIAPQAPAQNQ